MRRPCDDGMALSAFDMRDKAYAARIVFVIGIVEPLFLRQTTTTHGRTSLV